MFFFLTMKVWIKITKFKVKLDEGNEDFIKTQLKTEVLPMACSFGNQVDLSKLNHFGVFIDFRPLLLLSELFLFVIFRYDNIVHRLLIFIQIWITSEFLILRIVLIQLLHCSTPGYKLMSLNMNMWLIPTSSPGFTVVESNLLLLKTGTLLGADFKRHRFSLVKLIRLFISIFITGH